MIRATYTNSEGQAEVEVIGASLEAHTATIQPISRLSGYWWDNPSEITVNRDYLSNIRIDYACGVERCAEDPTCWNCGECWREKVSDEEDSELTQKDLIAEYQGRG